MKKTFTLPGVILRRLLYTVFLAGALVAGQASLAQSAVTAIFFHSQNATTATSYAGSGATGLAASSLASNSYTYKFGTNVSATNNTAVLDSFTSFGLNYYFLPVTKAVQFRRVDNSTVTGLRKSFLVEQSGGTVPPGGVASLLPNYDDSLERVFDQRMLNMGIDNLFQNASTNNNMNVERMDVLMPGGVSATDVTKAGFAVFDRGAAGGHDAFYIAAIKTLDGAGNPSAYYNAVSVGSGAYGSGVVGAMPYLILRKNPSDAKMLILSNNAPQNRDGTFLRFIDLNVPVNTMIYGYSIFSPDTNVSPATNMVDYTNATNFPTNTDLGGGGLDPLAITGLWVTNSSYVLLAENAAVLRADQANDKVRLSWQLFNTDNLQQLVIERSADGSHYSPLLHVGLPAAGSQSAFDEQPLPGKNYYRLQLVPMAGTTTTYTNTSWIDMSQKAFISVYVYPNPVKNKQFGISARGLNNEQYELRLFDSGGKLILRQQLSGGPFTQKEFHLPDQLAPGMYAVHLADHNGQEVFSRKITIE